MTSKKSEAPVLLIIILIGLIARLMYFFALQSDPFPPITVASEVYDQSRFYSLAEEILRNNWLGAQVTRYAPGYSYLIAVIMKVAGPDVYSVFLFQALMGVLFIFMFYKTAEKLFDNRAIAAIAAFMAALYSPFIYHENLLMRACLITYFNLFGFYFLVSALKDENLKHFFLSGVFIGLSMILRPNVLPLAIVPYLLISGRSRFKKALMNCGLFILALVLVLSPVILRNMYLGGKASIQSQGAETFWVGNTYDASGITLGITWARSEVRNRIIEEAGGSVPKTIRIFLREGTNHPREYLWLYLRKIYMYFNGYEIPANLSYNLFRENYPVLRICFLNFMWIAPLGLWGMILGARAGPEIKYKGLLMLFLAVLSLSVILFHIQGRYRLPAVPYFMLWAAYAVHGIIQKGRERDFPALRITGGVLIFLFLFTKPNHALIQRYYGGTVRPFDYESQSLAYYVLYEKHKKDISPEYRQRVLYKAIYFAQKAISAARGAEVFTDLIIENRINTARLYLALGQTGEAEEILKQLKETNPESPRKWREEVFHQKIEIPSLDLNKVHFHRRIFRSKPILNISKNIYRTTQK